METRASHLLIGSFVLLSALALFGFVLWLGKVQVDRETVFYDIYFEGNVAGLGLGGDVRYQGIKVGTVELIAVDEKQAGRVLVTVEVDSTIPIREGDEASLQLMGITGVSFVNIGGAEPGAEPLEMEAGQRRPVIPSKASAIEKLFQGAPALIAHGIDLAERATVLLSDQNLDRIQTMLDNLTHVSGELASRRAGIGRSFESLEQASQEFVLAARSARSTAARLDGLMAEAQGTVSTVHTAAQRADQLLATEVPEVLARFEAAAASLDRLGVEGEALIAESREPLQQFSEQGLAEISALVAESRLLVARLVRFSERLENEGASFLLNRPEAEFEP